MKPAPPVTTQFIGREAICSRARLPPSCDSEAVPALAVTIDTEFPDHPAKDPRGTLDRLLDLLKRRGVRATFFILGAWARAYPDRVSAMREAGHHIGNHSFSHCALTRMTETGIREDLPLATMFWPVSASSRGPGFAPPTASWRIDWAPGAAADSIAAALVAGVRAWWPRPAIVLLHSWPDAAPDALERVMDVLEPDGVSYLTAEEVD
jgi:peptidoglycan-N-acetylglucosamine deacetylase